MGDLRELKRATRIEELIEETGYTLDHKAGERYWTCLQDPDLRVDLQKQRYFWNSQNEQGDVIDWLVRRFAWQKSRAIKYLAARLDLPAEKRPKFPPVELENEPQTPTQKQVQPVILWPVTAGIGLVDNRDLQEVYRLASDIPGGIDPLLTSSYRQVIEKQRWIPKLFIPLVGEIEEAADYCSFCLEDLQGWKEKGVYLAIQVDSNFNIMQGDLTWNGVYCGRCVANFRRWLGAMELLVRVRAREERSECGAGAGEITQSITLLSDH